MDWQPSLDEYEKLVKRMNAPRVVIDNAVCPTATVVKVDSARKPGILLEAVQMLTDLDLSIRKAYISCDGNWFMDVFHVTDRHGHKLTDEDVISRIEKSLCCSDDTAAISSRGVRSLITLELTGADRPGLLSEVFAVLADLQYSVAQAKVWTYKGRVAALIFVEEEESGDPVEELDKVRCIKARLRNVVSVSLSSADPGCTDIDRRLHQMLLSDQELDRSAAVSDGGDSSVSIQNWTERGYSIVNVQCRDRPKLLFDTVCALTDLNYVIFHGKIDTTDDLAYQEFYIRRTDGSLIGSESERQTLIQCLQAAIDRRASEGLRLELYTADRRRGLLAEATRTFRENGLSVTMAEVSTKGDTASNVFYVTDAAGRPANVKTIDAVIEKIGAGNVRVCEDRMQRTGRNRSSWGEDLSAGGYLSSLVKRNLYNSGLTKFLFLITNYMIR